MIDPVITIAAKRAIVASLRNGTEPDLASITGIYEGVAPVAARYPFVTYQLQYDVYVWNWGSLDNHVGFAIFAYSHDQEEAQLIDRAVAKTLNDQALTLVDELNQPIPATTLYLRRASSLSFVDEDGEGHLVWQVGGIYSLWLTQQS